MVRFGVFYRGWNDRHRNAEWRTPESLFAAGVSLAPNNARLQYNLGKAALSGIMALC